MYRTIFVPLDNSDYSNAASELAVQLGKALEARLVGSHAYAAKLHDVRFKQMEFTLPDEYKEETELEKQRRIHDALIARGLQLISDSYLGQTEARAAEAGVPFEGKHYDGRNFAIIAEDIEESDYDLMILGALGQGAVRDSTVGSVCERLVRRAVLDTLVIRDLELGADGNDKIVVCIDGSAGSYGALQSGVELAAATERPIEVLVADGRSDALLGRHLEVARDLVQAAGIECSQRTITGSPATAILAYAEQNRPWLVVVGRTGLDASEGSDEIGSVAERLIRAAACNVLVSARVALPSDFVAAAE